MGVAVGNQKSLIVAASLRYTLTVPHSPSQAALSLIWKRQNPKNGIVSRLTLPFHFVHLRSSLLFFISHSPFGIFLTTLA
ncbi:hypothetical protein PIB30_073702 [Stylosanthes scabra]|uniref:Uncharacterized protein n=1 Tax=Stylosanthes scabra TaxID=79078 RepID=A0ABU6YNG0_9FABA|nr:hypothetical protein [Stylosanthes scabra]